jgi:hypothetical protein
MTFGGTGVFREVRTVPLAKGVVAADAGLGPLVPAALLALTVAVTAVPSVRPVITHEVAPLVAAQV